MNRRGFLTSLLATAVLDPERLLWVPGQKMISIPAAHIEVGRLWIELFHDMPCIYVRRSSSLMDELQDHLYDDTRYLSGFSKKSGSIRCLLK